MSLAAGVAGLAGTVFAAFAWAIRGHFRPGAMAPGMRAIAAVGLLALAAVMAGLWRAPPSSAAAAAGMVLMAAALALFVAAIAATRQHRLGLAFAPDAPLALLRSGPYRLVRHPFYAAYLLYWAGCAIAVPWPPVLAGAAAMSALYVAAMRIEERRFLASPLADEYRAYRRTTGAILPRLSALRGGGA